MSNNKVSTEFIKINPQFVFNDVISLRAKGLLITLLSVEENVNYTIKQITKLSTDRKITVRNTIMELENVGYLKRTPILNDKGKTIDWEFTVDDSLLL